MLRQRERANYDGSTSPVGRYVQAISAGILPSRRHVDIVPTESKLRALAVVMDTLNEAAIALLRQALFDDPRSGNAKTSEFRDFDAMADSSRPPKDVSCSEESMTSILSRLRDTKCFAFWSQAWGKCLRDGHWQYPLQAQAALDLWKAAARLYHEIIETDDQSTFFDMAVSTGVRVKIRSLEPLAMSWAERSEFDPPDVDCVSKSLRTFADQMNREHRNARMYELRQRSPNSMTLIADQSTMTTWVIIITLCSTIFLGLAWMHNVPEIGTAESSSFWFACQSSAMGLLGYFITIFPLYRRSWGVPWRWSLALGVLGAICAVAAVPAFLLLPEFWSSTLLFISTTLQAAVTLQLGLLAMQPAVPAKKEE